MQFDGSRLIAAPMEKVWRALNDIEVLRASIPGCKSLEQEGENTMTGAVAIKIGVVSATFKGGVTLSEIVPPQSYRITGEGKGGIAGFAKGHCDVRLEPRDGDMTELYYDARSEVGGKLASIGARLLEGSAKKLIAKFFDSFEANVTGHDLSDPGAAEDAGTSVA